jgi:hypothetical protein
MKFWMNSSYQHHYIPPQLAMVAFTDGSNAMARSLHTHQVLCLIFYSPPPPYQAVEIYCGAAYYVGYFTDVDVRDEMEHCADVASRQAAGLVATPVSLI